MLTVYRIAYGLILALFLANVLVAVKDQRSAGASSLLILAGVLLVCILGLVYRFSRFRPTVFWTLVLGWEILFVWYAWFSPVAPFVFREVHVLNAAGAAKESTVHYIRAGTLFAALFAWFLSLPFARMKWRGTAIDV